MFQSFKIDAWILFNQNAMNTLTNATQLKQSLNNERKK